MRCSASESSSAATRLQRTPAATLRRLNAAAHRASYLLAATAAVINAPMTSVHLSRSRPATELTREFPSSTAVFAGSPKSERSVGSWSSSVRSSSPGRDSATASAPTKVPAAVVVRWICSSTVVGGGVASGDTARRESSSNPRASTTNQRRRSESASSSSRFSPGATHASAPATALRSRCASVVLRSHSPSMTLRSLSLDSSRRSFALRAHRDAFADARSPRSAETALVDAPSFASGSSSDARVATDMASVMASARAATCTASSSIADGVSSPAIARAPPSACRVVLLAPLPT